MVPRLRDLNTYPNPKRGRERESDIAGFEVGFNRDENANRSGSCSDLMSNEHGSENFDSKRARKREIRFCRVLPLAPTNPTTCSPSLLHADADFPSLVHADDNFPLLVHADDDSDLMLRLGPDVERARK